MNDIERAAFEDAERAGEQALAQILAYMPTSDCAVKCEIAMALADGIRDNTGPAISGFLYGASGQIALALLSLASNQPTFHNH